ncbi:serine protease inhibitor ecotin [Burkholderia glumae]|uniref:serine protease inhibitor ecotin n=1 Tax=Burkholderia glumae TaxID=337 RepID=UPI003B9F31A2
MRRSFRLSLVFTAAVVSLGGAHLASAQSVASGAAASAPAAAAAAADLKMFPAPQPGMQRAVISLPPAELKDDLRVQVIVGKTMPTDCNVHFFPARLQHDTLPGSGYPYYRVTDIGPVAATKMACAPSATPQSAFVIGRGDGFLLRYNSRLPVVVYVPDGYEVRYRLWQGSNEVGRAVVR